MSERAQLISTIKRLLKAQGLTYRDVASALKISEPSVKRLFSTERLTVDRLALICDLLGFTMAELFQDSAGSTPRLLTLTEEQERQLVSNPKLLLVAVCAFNHWSIENIQIVYRLSKAECLKQLLALDRLGVIELLPGDRIRLLVARDFDWLWNGPIRQFFVKQGLPDFLKSAFDQPDQMLNFAHGMLTEPAQAEFQVELRRLKVKLAALHTESAAAPINQRRGTGILLAMREWEPAVFRTLRRGSID
jgi:transcriptional regulator with XRE-family HTH domain